MSRKKEPESDLGYAEKFGIDTAEQPLDPELIKIIRLGSRVHVVTGSRRRYASAKTAAGLLGIGENTVRTTPGVKIIRGIKGNTAFYSLDDAERARTSLLYTEITVDALGFWSDPETGADWATIEGFWDSLPDDHVAKERAKIGCFRKQAEKLCAYKNAKNRIGHANTKIFLVSELEEKALKLFMEEMRVDEKTGFYNEKNPDETETKWGTLQTWMKTFGVSISALNRGVKTIFGNWEAVPFIMGISQRGRYDKLYSEQTIREIISYILKAEIQIKNGVYAMRDGIREKLFKTVAILFHEVDFSSPANLRTKLKRKNCPELLGINRRSGEPENVFDYDRFREIFRDQMKVILQADPDGYFNHPVRGRCLNLNQYLDAHPEVPKMRFREAVKAAFLIAFRRKARGHHLDFFYVEKDLDGIAAAIAKADLRKLQ